MSEELSPCLHDVSDGGLAVAVAEIAIASGVGVTFEYADWRHLFSEDPHRFVFVADPAHRGRIEELGAACRATLTRIGEVGGEAIVFTRGTRTDAVDLDEATTTYRRALPRRLS